MSVVGEVVGIVACVAAIISAYKDGRDVVRKIRDGRAARKASPPTQLLETSLSEAARDIQNERDRGVSRFGETFNHGDEVAYIQLRQIKLELQSELFEQLVQALRDDNIIDFQVALNASDLGRDRTLTTLIDLRQRLVLSGPIPSSITIQRSTPVWEIESRHLAPRRQTIQCTTIPETSLFPTQPVQSPKSVHQTSPKSSQERLSPRSKEREGSVSYFPRFSLPFQKKGGGQAPRAEEVSKERPRRSLTSQEPQTRHRSYPGITQEYSDRDIQQSRRETYHGRREESQSPGQRAIFPEHDDLAKIWGNSSMESTKMFPYGPDTVGLGEMSSVPRLASAKMVIPTAQNDYLGFCKGAWKLQNGDSEAFKRKLEFNNGWSSSQVPYLACSSSKCVFSGRIPEEKLERVWHSSKGISFRWRFLGKSHVELSKAEGEYYGFQCVFCALMGRKSRTWFGVDTLLGHLVGHRGEKLPAEVLSRTNCIADRIAGDEEDFDINLRPRGPLGDDSSPSRDDSMFGEDGNPWA